jgi:arsenical pump membrane protein
MFLIFPIPALIRTVLISLITLFTLLGIMLRPWKVSEAITALTGAGLLLILGLLSPGEALATLVRDWNTFFFFLGMMSLAALAEVAGLFDWLAVQAARLSGNSSRRLFFNTFLLGSLISMLLSNDATALILTPIVYSLVTRLRLPFFPICSLAPSSLIQLLSCYR